MIGPKKKPASTAGSRRSPPQRFCGRSYQPLRRFRGTPSPLELVRQTSGYKFAVNCLGVERAAVRVLTLPLASKPLMSAMGHKQTSRHVRVMFVILLKTDIRQRVWHVRYVSCMDGRPYLEPKRIG